MPVRWRLILGNFADDSLPLDTLVTTTDSNDSDGFPLDNKSWEIDQALDFLYGREYNEGQGIRDEDRHGGKSGTSLTVPAWIDKVRKLFPRRTVEILQKEALEKYHLTEILTDPDILKTMEPNFALLKSILTFKHLISDNVKSIAYGIVEQAVREIQKRLETQVQRAFTGKKLLNTFATYKIHRNFDFKRTIRKNLKHYSELYKTIIPERLYFNQNVKRYNPWNIIILVDESGSMLDSVIYSAVLASIFAKLPFMEIKLVIFDTSLVDLSENIDDPCGILMKVQLGGGTNISGALEYAKKLIAAPQKTIVVLVSDLYDGNDYRLMYTSARDIIEGGAKLFVLPALDEEARGDYDKNAAKQFSKLGAQVAALTPSDLADWIGRVINGA
jgi:hypothetical protein